MPSPPATQHIKQCQSKLTICTKPTPFDDIAPDLDGGRTPARSIQAREFESSDSAAMCVAAKPEPTFAVSWVLFDALLPFIHGGGMVKDEVDPCYL